MGAFQRPLDVHPAHRAARARDPGQTAGLQRRAHRRALVGRIQIAAGRAHVDDVVVVQPAQIHRDGTAHRVGPGDGEYAAAGQVGRGSVHRLGVGVEQQDVIETQVRSQHLVEVGDRQVDPAGMT